MWEGASDIRLSPLVSNWCLGLILKTNPPDEQFKKDIQAVKLTSEQGSLSAIAKFNQRCLEKQQTKLHKEKGKTLRKHTPKREFKTNKSDNKPLSADMSVKT